MIPPSKKGHSTARRSKVFTHEINKNSIYTETVTSNESCVINPIDDAKQAKWIMEDQFCICRDARYGPPMYYEPKGELLKCMKERLVDIVKSARIMGDNVTVCLSAVTCYATPDTTLRALRNFRCTRSGFIPTFVPQKGGVGDRLKAYYDQDSIVTTKRLAPSALSSTPSKKQRNDSETDSTSYMALSFKNTLHFTISPFWMQMCHNFFYDIKTKEFHLILPKEKSLWHTERLHFLYDPDQHNCNCDCTSTVLAQNFSWAT